MKPVGVLLAALALSGAAAASAAEIAPPRQPMSNNRASDMQRMEACPVGSQAMLVEPSDVSFWLAQPTTAANPWLTSLPADLQLALAEERIDVGSVAVMCVPHSQRQFVGAAQAELRELKLQMLEEAEAEGGRYPLGYPDWYDAQQINLPNIPSQYNPFNPSNPGAGANPNAPGGGSNPYGNVPGIGTPMFRGASAELGRRLTLGRMAEREIFQQMQLEQTELFGAMQGEPAAEPTDPAYLRLRALQKRFGSVMEHIQQNKATQADVTELTDIMTALEREYAGYPPAMQEQVKESKDRLVMHIRKLRDELQDKLNKQKNGKNGAINQQRFSTMAAVASSSLRDLLSSASAMQTDRWGGSRFGYGVPSTRERSGGDRWGSRYSGDGRFGMGERIGYVGAEPRQLTATGRPVPQRYTPSHLSLTEEGSSADFHAAAIEVPGQDPGSIYWTAAVGSFGAGRSNWGRPGMGSSWGVGSGWPRTAFVSRAGRG